MTHLPWALCLLMSCTVGCVQKKPYASDLSRMMDTITDRKIQYPRGRIYEFHGETWIAVSGDAAAHQIPATYFYETPRSTRSFVHLAPPGRNSRRLMSRSELLKIYGPPDRISADKRYWIYWISDHGSLLGGH
jgi:hypothetical protein